MQTSPTDMRRGAAPEAPLSMVCFYAYGYKGRPMDAVRAPFATPESGDGLLGRLARIDGRLYRIVSILRQIQGPIVAGEMIGVEVGAPIAGLPPSSQP